MPASCACTPASAAAATPGSRRGGWLVVFYTSLRLAGWSTGWLEAWPGASAWLTVVDVAMVVPVAVLLAVELSSQPMLRPGKLAYLFSVAGLYLSLLLSVGRVDGAGTVTDDRGRRVSCDRIPGRGHALCLCRQTQGSRGLFAHMAQAWGMLLAVYVLLLGLVAVTADAVNPEIWLGINLWAAGLHYAYDGLIWKLRALRTAEALGVQLVAPENARAAQPQAASAPVAREPVTAEV